MPLFFILLLLFDLFAQRLKILMNSRFHLLMLRLGHRLRRLLILENQTAFAGRERGEAQEVWGCEYCPQYSKKTPLRAVSALPVDRVCRHFYTSASMRSLSLPASRNPEAERDGETILLVDAAGLIRVNPHNHSTRSDGRHSMRELADFAERHRVNLGVTDHNVPPEMTGRAWAPGLLPGMEIAMEEGVDMVVLGEMHDIHDLFESVVRPRLRGYNWQYRPTTLSIHELVDAVQGPVAPDGQTPLFHLIHPHYATVEGLSMLPRDQQASVLERTRHQAFLERNALMSRAHNDLAEELGQEWEMTVLASGDTHRDEQQHVGTFSAVPHAHLPTTDAPLVPRFLQSLRHPDAIHALRETTFREKLRTLAQVVFNNGVHPHCNFVRRCVQRLLGFSPAASSSNLPQCPYLKSAGRTLPTA